MVFGAGAGEVVRHFRRNYGPCPKLWLLSHTQISIRSLASVLRMCSPRLQTSVQVPLQGLYASIAADPFLHPESILKACSTVWCSVCVFFPFCGPVYVFRVDVRLRYRRSQGTGDSLIQVQFQVPARYLPYTLRVGGWVWDLKRSHQREEKTPEERYHKLNFL